MDRRLLFPAIAVSAMAQQPSAAFEAETALRARATQFYQLEVDGKYRQAEDLVAEDTKDYYFTNGKPRLRSFRLGKVELSADGTHAVVTLIATALLIAPGLPPQEVPVTAPHTWKLDQGKWCWYFDQSAAVETPFGKMHTDSSAVPGSAMSAMPLDPAHMTDAVSIDKTAVDLTTGPKTVTVTNHLPGPIGVEIGSKPAGLTLQIDKNHLGPGENAAISFALTGDSKPNGTVEITATPLNQTFTVQVTTK